MKTRYGRLMGGSRMPYVEKLRVIKLEPIKMLPHTGSRSHIKFVKPKWVFSKEHGK